MSSRQSYALTARQWTDLVNWIPIHFLSAQMTFVLFDDSDDQFEIAIRDKLPQSHRVITRREEIKEGLPAIASCAVINPLWGDAQMKVGDGTPLKDIVLDILSRYDALIVIGKNTGNEPAALVWEHAQKIRPNPVKRMIPISAPGASVYCFAIRGDKEHQSTSSKEPSTGRRGGEEGSSASIGSAAAAAASAAGTFESSSSTLSPSGAAAAAAAAPAK
jgi:hypothetical protein